MNAVDVALCFVQGSYDPEYLTKKWIDDFVRKFVIVYLIVNESFARIIKKV